VLRPDIDHELALFRCAYFFKHIGVLEVGMLEGWKFLEPSNIPTSNL